MSSPSQQRRSRFGSAAPSTSTLASLQGLSSNRSTLPSIESPDTLNSSSRPSFAATPQSPAASLFRVPESPRSAGAESRASKAAKVAIPRLKRAIDGTVDGNAKTGGRHRVNHACEPCRHRKTKCSGERPICRHCQDFKIVCFYADGKRDRVKKQFGSLTEKVADYEKLLKDLVSKVGETDARAIKDLLEKDTSQNADLAAVDDEAESVDADAASESGAESVASAGVGSTGALDRTEEDFTRDDARSTGFMGKNSELTWLQRVRQENYYSEEEDKEEFHKKTGGGSPLGESQKDNRSTPMPEHEEGFAVRDNSYHLDDLPIAFEAVEPHEMPTAETANHLFDAYMSRVHATFPIIGRSNLTSQFHKFITGRIRRPPAQWLAILNLIFAIGAKYSHLILADWRGDDRDHLIYFSRARILAMNGETIFEHPDLQKVQIMGLTSFYLLCTSQINRSWTLGGMAVRAAVALGLNMRNESSKLADDLKEIRYRVWWALYTLEHRLCSMTGRANSILDDYCTTPLPIPVEEDQFGSEDARVLMKTEKQQGDRNPADTSQTPSLHCSTPSSDRSPSHSKPELSRSPSSQQHGLDWAKNIAPSTSTYFLHLVQLTRLSQQIFLALYNPKSMTGSWSHIQTIIKELNTSLESWYRNLPPILDFRRKQRDKDFTECRFNLGFVYYGTRITINRPCLCRLDRKIKGQSQKSSTFNRDSAANCVEAAQELLGLIPDDPNAIGLNCVGPWWCLLHFLVQATTVLMLELSFRAHHMPEEADSILDSAKKGVKWMHQLGEGSFSARRAWLLCNSMLRDAAGKIGREVTDLPEQPPAGRSSVSSQGYSDVSMHSNPYVSTMPAGFSTVQAMPNSQAFASMDHLIRYDQPYSVDARSDPLDYTQTEMDFMTNAYHQFQNQPPGMSSGGSTRSQYN